MQKTANLSGLERQEQLQKFVEENGRITVEQICAQFSVSPATARRDLEALAEQGTVERFHGGAKAAPQAPPEGPIIQRNAEQADEKQSIGRAAANLINDGETVFLGSGTTVLQVARNLRNHQNLTVITNSLLVLNALVDLPEITLVGLGGMLRPSEMSMIGHITEQALKEVHAHKTVMGIHALDIERGLTNDYMPETLTDRAILDRGGEVIIVADHTKCERVSTVSLAPITVIDKLVTDSNTPPEFVESIRAKDVEVIVAE